MAKPETPNKPSSKKPKQDNKGTYYGSPGQVQSALNKSASKRALYNKAQREQQAKDKKDQARLKVLGRRRLSINELNGGKIACYPNNQIVGGKGWSTKQDNSWICLAKSQYAFKEKSYAVQECEVRIFIEGAEVTSHVRGSVQWTYQTTGGMNTCNFTLNNNHDVFIITPANICAGTDHRNPGWRLSRTRAGKLISHESRGGRNVDELAKFLIYSQKLKRVAPDTANQKIDDDGVWLYPLDPHKSIFNTHDCVRIFYRLPHVTGVGLKDPKTGKKRGTELWAPAFTGFIADHDFDDDPVSGDRMVNIHCYDFRGLLERMRVRVINASLATIGAKTVTETSPLFSQARKDAKTALRGENDGKAKPPYDVEFLKELERLGLAQDLQGWFTKRVNADITVRCAKGDSSDIQCIIKVAAETKARIQSFLDPLKEALRTAYNAIEGTAAAKNLDGLNEITGKKHTLKRLSPTSVGLDTSSSVAADTNKAAQKAIGLLRTTGAIVNKYILAYSTTYNAVNSSAGFAQSVVGKVPTGADGSFVNASTTPVSVITAANKNENVVALDARLKAEKPGIYAAAGLDKAPNVNRIYLLNDYLNKAVVAAFAGVPDGFKKTVDTWVETAAGASTHLFFGRVVGGSTFPAGVRFYTDGIAVKVANAIDRARTSTYGKYAEAQTKVDESVATINRLLPLLNKALVASANATAAAGQKDANLRKTAKREKMVDKVTKAHVQGKDVKDKKGGEKGSIADLVVTDAKFSIQNAGMYRDLVRAQETDPHPLAGMSFETAVLWLTLTHLYTSPGYEWSITEYQPQILQDWNNAMIFGILGRPMTYAEVSEMGKGTITEANVDLAPYSPLHCFIHLMLPGTGTGARTIVQQDITHNAGAVKNYDYASRLQLLNQICETLDYQFFCTPSGDLAFEFPHYNAIPSDFGKTYLGAYTVTRGIRACRVSTNESQMNTAWVLTGTENERIVDDVSSTYIAENQFKKAVLVAPMLTRRIGAKVKQMKVSLPGVGAVFGDRGAGKPLSALLAYGLVEMQRELGKAETLSVTHEFRPYLLPNRPIHVVHRQRIGLTRTVNYSMAINGECVSQSELHYVRGLSRDGRFRFMAGGTRMPVDYSKWYTGETRQNVKSGTSPGQTKDPAAQLDAQTRQLQAAYAFLGGPQVPKDATNLACSPYLNQRYLEAANSYSDQINSAYSGAKKYNAQTSGSGGEAGFFFATSAPGYIGARTFREAANNGNPAAAVELRGTGIVLANGDNSNGNTTNNAYGRLHNPWPFSIYDKEAEKKGTPGLFSQWGFFRKMTATGNITNYTQGMRSGGQYKFYRKHDGVFGRWHNGIDFNGIPNLTKAYTPIELFGIHAVLNVGSSLDDQTRYTKYVLPAGTPPPAIVQKLGWLNFDTKSKQYSNYNGTKLGFKREIIAGVPMDVYYVDKVAQKIYDQLQKDRVNIEKNGVDVKTTTQAPNMGLSVYGFGFVSLPSSPSTKLACCINYVHCGALAPRPQGGFYGDAKYYPNEAHAPADSVVALVGQSGTNKVHLHFEMRIYPPGSEPRELRGKGTSDPSAWKEILKANETFLRTAMRMKITSGKGNTPNGARISDSWQSYFEAANRTQGTNITNADQAVDYMLSRSKHYNYYTNPAAGKYVYTNPLFFFKPEQIIKSEAKKYAAWEDRFKNVYFDTKRSGANVCGATNEVAKQKLRLEYAICRAKTGKARNPKEKKTALTKCYTNYTTALAASNGTTSAKNAVADRADRKIKAQVKRQVQTRSRGSNTAAGA